MVPVLEGVCTIQGMDCPKAYLVSVKDGFLWLLGPEVALLLQQVLLVSPPPTPRRQSRRKAGLVKRSHLTVFGAPSSLPPHIFVLPGMNECHFRSQRRNGTTWAGGAGGGGRGRD